MNIGYRLPKLLIITASFILLSVPSSATLAAAQTTSNQMVLDRGNHSWDSFVWRPSVLYRAPVFTMWYSGQDTNGLNNIGAAFSTDGLSWARYDGNPILIPGPSNSWDSGSVQEPWVIYDGSEYKMWYTGESFDNTGAILSIAIGLATSTDGTHWSKFQGNPVLSPGAAGSWNDQWVFRPTVIFTGTSYTMYYEGKSRESDVYRIGMVTSTDGKDWVATQTITIPPSGWNSYSTFLGGTYKIADQYVMLIYGSQSSTQPNRIGFAKSPDGVTWTTYPATVITPEGAGSWDDAGVILPSLVIAHDNYYIYYTGIQQDVGSRIGLSIVSPSSYPIPEFAASPLAVVLGLLSWTFFVTRRRLRKTK